MSSQEATPLRAPSMPDYRAVFSADVAVFMAQARSVNLAAFPQQYSALELSQLSAKVSKAVAQLSLKMTEPKASYSDDFWKNLSEISGMCSMTFQPKHPHMGDVYDRFMTLYKLPYKDLDRLELARNGFYYRDEKITCFCCGLIIKEKEVEITKHNSSTQSCIHIQEINKNPYIYNFNHLKFKNFNKRLETFSQSPFQNPHKMAAFGFYYLGMSDEVKCFCCNGHLKNWKETYHPFYRHKFEFPYFLYI